MLRRYRRRPPDEPFDEYRAHVDAGIERHKPQLFDVHRGRIVVRCACGWAFDGVATFDLAAEAHAAHVYLAAVDETRSS